MQPTWYSLPDYLIEQFPALRAEIEETYLSWLDVCENPYPHVFLGEFIGALLCGQRREASSDDRLRAGLILEQLLISSDQDLAESALTSIVEVLRDETELRDASWPFLGPIARKWVTELRSERGEHWPN